MRDRQGAVNFLLFLLLAAIILMQIFSMVQSDRFYRSLNRLEEFLRYGPQSTKSTSSAAIKLVEDYPGDEGDWLVWAFRVEPKTLNQFSADNDIYSRWITVPYVFEPLLFYDYDDLTMEPWLAQRYEISDDGLEITFYLRDDIHFSDGVAVTADDVIFTYETAVDANVDAANIANLYYDVEKVVKVSDRVVKFVSKEPYFKALENLSFFY